MMKKIFFYIAFLSALTVGLVSCGDNMDFSKEHVLTDAEIKEMARQDSIKEAQKNNINANLVLNYSLDITISKTVYDGAPLTIDLDKIAKVFSVSKDDLLKGIAAEAGAIEIKPFAIEGSTHADNTIASNTNSTWGHWWDANGNVTKWGETAMIFCEFDTENGIFNIGQYPGHLTDGQTLKVIECLKYKEKRAAVVITVNAKAPGKLSAPIVGTQEIKIDVLAKTVYDADSVQFDLAKAKTDLGVTSLKDAKWVGINEDGSFATEYTADAPGFWYDLKGFVGSWGDNASVYTSYGVFKENRIGIGQYPGHLKAGQTLTIQYGILANNKIEMLKITINVKEYQDPETAPTGDPKSVEKTIELSKTYTNDYGAVQVDVKELLRDAFKKTTYQIHKAIAAGELKLYQGAVTTTDPKYTADVPGYWLKADGTAGEWAAGLVFVSLGHSETELYLYGGNHPDNGIAGSTVTTKLIATYNGGTVTFNITFKVTKP
jgi:hypothetical protein